MSIFTYLLPRGSAPLEHAINPMGPHFGASVAATTVKQAVDLSLHVGQYCSVRSAPDSENPVYVVVTNDVAAVTNEAATGVAVVGNFPKTLAPGGTLDTPFVVSPSAKYQKLVIWTADGTATVIVDFS